MPCFASSAYKAQATAPTHFDLLHGPDLGQDNALEVSVLQVARDVAEEHTPGRHVESPLARSMAMTSSMSTTLGPLGRHWKWSKACWRKEPMELVWVTCSEPIVMEGARIKKWPLAQMMAELPCQTMSVQTSTTDAGCSSWHSTGIHTHRHDICTNPCVLNNMPCDAHPSTTHIKSAHALTSHCQHAMTDSDKQQITHTCTNNVQWQQLLPPKSPCTHTYTQKEH